jgi:hypothetical protein
MLYGFALENAIKGYLIEKCRSFEDAMKADKEAWKGHRLQALARATGLPLTEEQGLLLASVEALISWAGRYPVPLRREKFTLNKQLGEDNNSPPILLDKVERAIIDPFYRAVTDALHANILARLSDPFH